MIVSLVIPVWFASVLPAAGPLIAGTGGAYAPLSNFVDSAQELGGNVESSAVALGDLDDDGDLDAIVASFGGSSKVYLNQGGSEGGAEGVFLDSGQSLATGSAVDVELQDLDGDGDLDAFMVKDAFGDANEVWINQGAASGIFTQTSQIFGNNLSTSVALGDLDGANGPDAFISRGYGQPSKVWLNSGDGNFYDSGQTLDTDSNDVALGDLDGDNDLDAFSANSNYNKIWVNQGGAQMGTAGVFLDSEQLLGRILSLSVELGDLDGDGDLDVWAGNSTNDRIWVNQGGVQGGTEGAFLAGASTSLNQTRDIALGDLDGDGDLDAFVVLEKLLSVLLSGEGSNPPGVFIVSQEISTSDWVTGVALGDLAGDGDLDAFVTIDGPNKILVNGLLGNEGVFTDSGQTFRDANSSDVALGDLDEDGDLDAFTTTAYEDVDSRSNEIWENGGDNLATQCLGSAKSMAVALGDLDGDGDLDAFVANMDSPDKVWFNGQGAFCSCTVAWLFEEIEPLGVSRAHVADSNLISRFLEGGGLQTYLDLRDDLFSQYPDGRRYARLYDDNNAEIYGLLFSNAALRDEGLATLQLWQPGLQALLDGQGDSATISAAQVQVVDDFLANLSAVASPELQQVIATERAKLPPPSTFIGMTLEEARGIVLPDAIYLPSILRQ